MTNTICYIVITRKGKFKPCIGTVINSEGDDDQFVYESVHNISHSELSDAIAFLNEYAPVGCDKYLIPINEPIDGIIWMSELNKIKSIGKFIEMSKIIRSAYPSTEILDEIDDDQMSGKRRTAASFIISIKHLREYDKALVELMREFGV